MDRRSLIALLIATLAVLFFTSETWNRTARKALGMPPPVVRQIDTAKAASVPTLKADSSRLATDTASSTDSSLAKVDSLGGDSSAPKVNREVTVVTGKLMATIAARGGRLEALSLSGVTNHDGVHTPVFPRGLGGGLTLRINEDDLSNVLFTFPDSVADTIRLDPGQSLSIRQTWQSGTKGLERTWSFKGGSEAIGVSFHALGWKDPAVRLSWNAGILPLDSAGPKKMFSPPHVNSFVWRDVDEVTNHTDFKPVSASGQVTWMGLRTQYTMATALFNSPRDGDLEVDSLQAIDGKNENSHRWAFRWRPEGGRDSLRLVATPLEVGVLKSYNAQFEKVLFNGWAWFFRADVWFSQLCLFVLGMLRLFHKFIPNYGVAIILLTIVARGALLPLSLKQIKQSKRMAEVMPKLKPQLEVINSKYKDDARKKQEETMKLYSQYGINPLATMAGCLPLFLQMPVFIALYQVLGRAIELRGQPFFGWIRDLSQSDVILPNIRIPLLFEHGITVLPLLMAASLYFLNKMTIKDPQQKPIIIIMPIMMLLFSGSFPSGLVLYWTVSNLFTMAQTTLVRTGPIPEMVVSGTPVRKPRKG